MVGASSSCLTLGINGGHVEAELADVLGLELPGLDLDDDVAMQLGVVEEQVEEEVVAADLKVHLPSDVGEAGAQLNED